ncbi:hypothetical protein B4N89_13450 [Embleya scabrispora]|uniref:Uncharacterized protein n=1 Tax=Embleya scabrispora TaxID=159449 RepID=A0A1T3NY78_9ACTN|nr:hypothetical protein B4N89_13450 [Embleya scabrispora]
MRVDLSVGGTWTDITGDVYLRDAITITRGRADEAARVDAGKCTLTLNNRSGKYSPRNPTSPYYGRIGRNTPIRVTVAAGPTALDLPGTAGARASTPDTAALDITGDIDIRLDATLDNWFTGGTVELIAKWGSGTDRAWRLLVQRGYLYLAWFDSGGAFLQPGTTTAIDLPPTDRLAVRATLDVNNGAGEYTATFYQAPTIAGPWTMIGAPVTGTTGTTALVAGGAPLQIGDLTGFTFTPASGRVHAAQVRNGINGTIVADPQFAAQAAGTTSFVDSAGRAWSVTGTAVGNRATRFVGEVSAWPARWDVSGRDVWVPLQAAGVLRRLGQGASPLDSTLRRRIPSRSPLAYWPMEEERDATRAYSPIANVDPLAVDGFSFAADDTLAGSSALPTINAAASMSATVPTPAVPTGQWCIEFVYFVPADSIPTVGSEIIGWRSAGTAIRWHVTARDGEFFLQAFDDAGGLPVNIAILVDGKFGGWVRQQVSVTQNGSDVDWLIRWDNIGGDAGQLTGTYPGDAGAITSIDTVFGAQLDKTRIGHLAVFATDTTDAYALADHGFNHETAGARIARLAGEEGITARVYGNVDDQVSMGPQRPDTLLTLLQDAADADGGVLYEARDTVALCYRPRTSLYNQTPRLALDYAAPGEVAPPLEPVDDDQAVRNDVTVTRAGGSSARAVDTTTPLSTLPPPTGVGRYDEAITLNLADDTQPADHAGWRLHLGTWNEARYPLVHVDLAAAPHLTAAAITLDVGDRLTIAHPPAWLPPDPIDLIAQGYTETIGAYSWDLGLTCTPAGPWTVGIADTDRVDTDGSELAAAASTTATTLSVAVTDGPLWTTAGTETPFDIRVAGEVMTVTAISGASSPQTFTVVRSVNGVVKPQDAGADVRLARPTVVAL